MTTIAKRNVTAAACFACLAGGPALLHAQDQSLLAGGGWVRTFPRDDIVTTLADMDLSTWGDRVYAGSPRPEPVRTAYLEIRTTDNTRRIAFIKVPTANASSLFSTAYSQSLITYPLHDAPSVPAGNYQAAWIINGSRRSNVVRLTIDPQKDLAKLPRVRLVQVEPDKAGAFPQVVVYVSRAKATDPAPTNSTVAHGLFIVDGTVIPRSIFEWNGPDEPLPVGVTYGYSLNWENTTDLPDLSKPHTIAVRISGLEGPPALGGANVLNFPPQDSAPVPLVTGTPLADAWDKATLPAAPDARPVLAGEVVIERKPAARPGQLGNLPVCELTLTGKITCQELSDWQGRFDFRNLPADTYTLSIHPRGQQFPRLTIEKVTLKDGPLAQLKPALTGSVELTGRVTRPDGTPAAKIPVFATWTSDDGMSTLKTMAATAADGTYAMRSPFGKCETLAYPDGDAEIRIDRTGSPPIRKETRDIHLTH